MKLQITRPTISPDKWNELQNYLLIHWERAIKARTDQIDSKYSKWMKNYAGEPREKERTWPWPRSSNYVVKLIRTFVDTFVDRSLNIVFATRPLYVLDGFPSDLRSAIEYYLNRKALGTWQHYELAKSILIRGAKGGTAVIKTVWKSTEEVVMKGDQEQNVLLEEAPMSYVIPFEDFCVYPITAPTLDRVVISFHRIRYVVEEAVSRSRFWRTIDESGQINPVSREVIQTWEMRPNDLQREEARVDRGLDDSLYQEVQVIECHLKYSIDNSGRQMSIVATICPQANKLIDVYYNPNPFNLSSFTQYTPWPVEDLFYGDSLCGILEQSQEEASQIHNDRRNNAMLANTVIFKRKNGSQIPNPSTNWYPGKVFDLDNIDDLQVEALGRNYNDMISEEQFVIELAERLSGISSPMQGMGFGSSGKRGVYNTQGVLGMMAEGNQRQDTNIRDVRQVLSRIGKFSLLMQSTFGSDDAELEVLPPEISSKVTTFFQASNSSNRVLKSIFDAKASNAGANKEAHKASLIQLAQVLGQYGATVMQMINQLANPGLNPALRDAMSDVAKMHRWIAASLLRAWDEHNTEEILPDVIRSASIVVGGGQAEGAPGGAVQPGMEQGGAGPSGGPVSLEGLEALLGASGSPQGPPPEQDQQQQGFPGL